VSICSPCMVSNHLLTFFARAQGGGGESIEINIEGAYTTILQAINCNVSRVPLGMSERNQARYAVVYV